MRVKDYINVEFRAFSRYDCVRSIPSVKDGFKPSQRKCVYGTQLRGENAGEVQVERLAAQIAAETLYHHGTGSLESTLVGLAQNYPGSNNINFFEPSGQFGSRLSAESASARYIFTKFTQNFRKLYKKEDDIILHHLQEDGQKIEPECYIPILPTVLINGSRGVGTGYASLILNYNPEDIKKYILTILDGKIPKTKLVPWYNGFKGTVERNEAQTVIKGILKIVNTTTIKVSELPIGMFLDDFKEVLYKLEDSGFIKSFEDRSTEEGFDFTINCPRSTTLLSDDELITKFKLISRETENYTLWDTEDKIKEYESVEEIITDFVSWRLERYEERRQKIIDLNKNELAWLNEKLRFVLFYLKHTKEFSNKPKKELFDYLTENNFVEVDKLMRLPIYTLTHDEIEKLKKEIENIEAYIAQMENTTAEVMYSNELKELKLEA